MVEATRPAVLMLAPLVNNTPLELRIKTLPLALRAPSMTDCSVPVTRFRAMADAEGWTKLTVAFWPTEKPSQSIATFWLDWVMVIVLPTRAPIAAAPAVTLPFVGSVSAGISGACASVPASSSAPPERLPRERAVSATATNICRAWLQTWR